MKRVLPLLLLLACAKPAAEAEAPEQDAGETAVPVKLAQAKRMDFDEVVQAPGATEALNEHKLKAPWAGHLVKLNAVDGAHLAEGEVVAEIVSQESDSAIAGAEAMARSARTPEEKAEAERALSLAKGAQVNRVLRAPVSGVVLSHSVSAGEFVAAGDELLVLASPNAIVFVAQVVQTDLAGVHAGQVATVRLASNPRPVVGTVRALLPSASAAALTQPVRIDLKQTTPAVGLFGTASIVTGHHPGAIAVPQGAVLRDDVTGVSRVAVVDAKKVAHWVEVRPGLSQDGWVELPGASLAEGASVITDGQVGLPEGAKVVPSP